MAFAVLVSLALLSLQPHQELRFLTPLLLPCVVLAANLRPPPAFGGSFWVRAYLAATTR